MLSLHGYELNAARAKRSDRLCGHAGPEHHQ